MGRKPKRCPKKCERHRFLLKPVAYFAHLSRDLDACFCPSSLKDPSITPTFNKDNCYFTSGFYLPVDYVRDILVSKSVKKMRISTVRTMSVAKWKICS